MPSDASFDIVSEIRSPEMDNAMNQAIKEITTRYDFKGTSASAAFDRKAKELTLTADASRRLETVRKVVVEKMINAASTQGAGKTARRSSRPTHKTVRQKVLGSRAAIR